MKTNFIKTICVVFVTLFAVATVSALDTKVISVTGKVEVQKDGEWVAVKAGDTLEKGAVISTGFKSSANLRIYNSDVTIGALTRVTVSELATSDEQDKTDLFLDSGSVKASVNRVGEKRRVSFNVSSPVATASVRGTIIEATPTTLTVFEGLADQDNTPVAQNQQANTHVSTGEKTTPQENFVVYTTSTTNNGTMTLAQEKFETSGGVPSVVQTPEDVGQPNEVVDSLGLDVDISWQ